MNKFILTLLILFITFPVFSDARMGITTVMEWDSLNIQANVSLDLVSAGIRLPSGRTQGETLLNTGYINMIQPGLMNLQIDSSSTLGDLVESGEFSIADLKNLAMNAQRIPPVLSSDLRNMSGSWTISLTELSAALLRHTRPAPVARTLTPVSTASYTGIIIIASENLPIHGMRSSALPVPCLFPKIWDSDMNLIYERNMLENTSTSMVRYAPLQSIFQNNPSGLTSELVSVVGERPLRIFARGVFGITPTDLIIDRNDAMLIISSDENRRLLSQGRVVFILDDSVLRQED